MCGLDVESSPGWQEKRAELLGRWSPPRKWDSCFAGQVITILKVAIVGVRCRWCLPLILSSVLLEQLFHHELFVGLVYSGCVDFRCVVLVSFIHVWAFAFGCSEMLVLFWFGVFAFWARLLRLQPREVHLVGCVVKLRLHWLLFRQNRLLRYVRKLLLLLDLSLNKGFVVALHRPDWLLVVLWTLQLLLLIDAHELKFCWVICIIAIDI